MNLLPFLLLFLLCATNASAQKKTFVTVKAGNNIMDVLSKADVFLYPQFTPGTVVLKDGTTAAANLNYSRLMDEMHFINPKGDTLALANEEAIRHVVIGNDTFLYNNGYLRLLSAGNAAKLAFKQVWLLADARKVGAYNNTNNSVGVTSYTSMNEGGRLYDLVVDEDLILKKEEQYCLGDNYNHFVSATKKNLLLLFPKEQQRMQAYLKEAKTDFSKKADLEELVRFLESL